MIVLVDVDSTVANLMPEWLRLYNNDYSDNLTVDKITDWEMTNFVHPDCGKNIYSYLFLDTLYDNVKPIDGALEGLQFIESLGHRVVFVSSGVYAYPKYQWMERNKFNVGKYGSNYIVCHDKSLINGNLLIDDGVHNIQAFNHWQSILFDQPWNRNFNWEFRAKSWSEVCKIFEERY